MSLFRRNYNWADIGCWRWAFTSCIFNFPDITGEGSITLGAAVAATCWSRAAAQ
jgi:hypothetical protein